MPPIHLFQNHDERLAYEAKFANSTERLEWEDKFGAPVGPFEYEEGPEPAPPTRRRHRRQGGRPPKQEPATGYRGHDSGPSSESSISSSTSSRSGSERRSSTLLYNASLAFSVKHACKYTDIQYCAVDTQNVIRALDGFQKGRWKRLRKELLQAFDADRVFQKYKPADVEHYVAKKQQQVCHNLTQWREYFVKFHKIAGGPLAKGHLKLEDYNAYFFIGIHPSLRQLLETRILLANPRKRDREQYTVKEINDAAEGHFRRDRHEAMMVRSAELGEDRDEDYSGEGSDSDSESEETDSEYEAFKRAKKKGKEKAKKKKQDQKKKTLARKGSGSSETQKYQGNEEEIARLITKLSKMSLDDKDYAPIYYKVMVMDQKGVAEKQVTSDLYVQPAERTETSIKKSRKVTFDGVYPPRRERGKPEVRDLQAKTKGQTAEASTLPSPQNPPLAPATSVPAPDSPPPPLTGGPSRTETQPADFGKPGMETSSPRKAAARTRTAHSKPGILTPDIRPIDARKIRSSVDGDIEMTNEKDKKQSSKKAVAPERKESRPEEAPVRSSGQQCELSGTVDMKAIINRVLDTEVQMTGDAPPRFELLAVPYDGPPIGTTPGPVNQYMSFMMTNEPYPTMENSRPVLKREAAAIARIVGDMHKRGGLIASNGCLERIHHEYRKELKRRNATLQAVLAAPASEETLRVLNRYGAGRARVILAEPLRRRRRAGANPSQKLILQNRVSKGRQKNDDSVRLTGILNCIEDLREREGQHLDYIKGKFAPRLSPTRCAPVFIPPFMPSYSNRTSTSVSSDARLRLVVGSPPPFQYLSRANLPHGPMSAMELNTQGPVAAVAEAVSHTWQQLNRHEPMMLSLTFSSSPQSVYYGQTLLPDGQVLHRSASMNTFRVFQDSESGIPITMTGHEFTFHLACPEDQHTLWNLETPYPTDTQMQDVMRRFVPPMVAGAVALTFPMHGTEVAPPMLPIEARLRLDEAPTGHGSAAEVLRPELTTVAPDQLNATNLAKLPRGLAMPTPRGLMGSGLEARHVIAKLEEQLYQRASKRLQLTDDYFVTHPAEDPEDSSTTDADSCMPGLVSVPSDGTGSNASIDIGFCDLCLAPQHESELACPRFEAANIEGALGRAALTNTPLGKRNIGDDRTNLIRENPEETDNEGELRVSAVFNQALGEYEVLGTREAVNEAREMRSTLEASVLPSGDTAFRMLVNAAVHARDVFEEFTTERDHEQKERGEASRVIENGTIVVEDADQTGSGVQIRPLTPFSSSLSLAPLFQLRLPSTLQERDGTPEPEDRHSDDGTPVLRRRASAPLSHADHVPLPVFTRRGRVITRDQWSSSPASLPGGPFYNLNEHTTPAERVETIAHEEWSPAVSEGAWGWPASYPPSYAMDSDDPSSASSESNSGFSCTSRYEFYDDNNFELHESLSFWVRDGNEHQRDHRRFENEMGVEPFHQAIQTLHGPLSFFVDYLAMAGQGVKDLVSTAFAPSPYHASVFPADSDIGTTERASDAPPDSTAIPTSLDQSLPAERPTASPTLADSAVSEGEWEEVVVEPLSTGTRKRKHPDGEEGGLNQQGRRKRTPAGMADERAVRLMAGVRLAVLEALQRVEDMVWHRYGITEYAFPDKLIRHPFLHPLEAAKLQVLWHILQRNGRDILADAVHEILSIRLHKDYAVSAFFNAASLDESYSERDWDYWHLLGEEYPQSLYLRNYDVDSSDSGSMGGLEYPLSENDAAPGAINNGAGPGHHEPCRDLNGAGPITLVITLREDTALAE
ncbi:hypothetical protein K438DRAFT_1967068 [Mycena galopus ATCC 62051]|nr:hypothetical protein K438DRAFT_1967068 [Mycena galopus ATCC 62051]